MAATRVCGGSCGAFGFALGDGLVAFGVDLRLLLGRQHTAHDGSIHLVLLFDDVAGVVLLPDDEEGQRAFLVELLGASLDRQDTVEIAFAIGGLVTMPGAIAREDADGVKVPRQAVLVLVGADEILRNRLAVFV